MSKTLNQLVRNQILAEGPQHLSAHFAEKYIDEQLNTMLNVELLERISDALDSALRDLPTRLGI